MAKVLVLGGSGMLGSMIIDWLARDGSCEVGGTMRSQRYLEYGRRIIPDVKWHIFDVGATTFETLPAFLDDYDWIINAIGVIKPLIHDDNPMEVEQAIRVNALFPHSLARKTESCGKGVLQIATDCVYSGDQGNYAEDAPHDPLDVYGKTKSLGEVYSSHVFHLRCSIIGPEPTGHVSLLDWFLRRPPGAGVNGFTNHRWNGVTTLHFAKICCGIVKQQDLELPHLQHIVPTMVMTKADMLEEFARQYGRQDIEIGHGEAAQSVDRTLSTKNQSLNQRLWETAGYGRPPSIPEMIRELHEYEFRFAALDSSP